ncbi:MAG: hypothetical protein J5871_00960 [Bacteroidales bacterium]|nr:hypothetical protein [Bacteroidales bacterium]
MENKFVKVLVEVLLLCISLVLLYLIYSSIMKPVNFNKQKAFRESVAIQRLKDIRTLQVAYKGIHNRFLSTVDSLKIFYESGQMVVDMQVGSADDSLAWAHTEQVKKKLRGKDINEQLFRLYQAGDTLLVFSVASKIPVRDTLFRGRENFCIDSLLYIPFSGKQKVEMEAVTRQVSGVPVPLFEARMPYKALLQGLDNQLRINLDCSRRDQNKYEGLQVGSVSVPNNNAGNWE